MNPLAKALAENDTLLCVGSGGVGKTTVSAALALRASLEGKGSLVCTIDPAKRLANSLGLAQLGNTETRIQDETLKAAGLEPKAPMHAMMLDMKRAWDDLVERRAPPEKREKILNNRFYQSLSTVLAGSQEYIAMEKLCDLRTQNRHPLIVLDTPPTAHALDFLDAPNRILDFLDSDAARWLMTPALAAGKFGLKLFSLGSSYITSTIAKFTGGETLQELASFMIDTNTMYESFRERAHQTRALLEAKTTAFVLVTAPMPERINEAVFFHTMLKQNQIRVAAIVVNRVHAMVPDARWHEAAGLSPELKKKVEQTLTEQEHLAKQDAIGIARLTEQCPGTPLVQVPRFELDVHDLKALHLTSEYLVGAKTP